MDSGYWQSQFEDWLRHHHQEQDAAHDIFHFRRVWATAQTLGENSPVDWLVVLSACYFHDIVSLAKNHPQRHRSSILAAAETRRIFLRDFPDFPAENWRAFVMLSKRIASAQKLRLPRQRQKSCRMQTGWRRWAPLVWRGSSRSPARWASRYLMPTIPLPTDGLLTISNSRSTIFKPNC